MQFGYIFAGDRESVIVNADDRRAATLPDCFAATGLGTGPDTVQAVIGIGELARQSNSVVHIRTAR